MQPDFNTLNKHIMQNTLINSLITDAIKDANLFLHNLDLIAHNANRATSDCSYSESWVISLSNWVINEDDTEYSFSVLDSIANGILGYITREYPNCNIQYWDPYTNNPSDPQCKSQNILITAPGLTLTIIFTDYTMQIHFSSWDC